MLSWSNTVHVVRGLFECYLGRIQYMLHGCSGQLMMCCSWIVCVILVEYSTCYMGVVDGRIQYMLHGCSGQLISDVLFVDCFNVICYMGVVISQ